MLLIYTDSFSPFFNLAAEEYYLNNSDDDIFMLWRNLPTVVIGRNQNIYAEVDLDYAALHGISVVRRITGGGAVYHDLGNVNYSFITSRGRAKSLDFAYFTRPVIDALSKLYINASLSGRNDLEADGLKFSGNAQYSTKSRILHHGTLLFDSDLSVLSRALKPDSEKLEKKAIKSVRSRVTNLKPLLETPISTEEFISNIAEFVKLSFSAEVLTANAEAVKESDSYRRLLSENWIYGRRENHEYTRKYSFSGGIVTVLFDIKDGKLARVKIEGDFFGEGDVSALEKALCDVSYEQSDICSALESANISRIIAGADAYTLAGVMTEE